MFQNIKMKSRKWKKEKKKNLGLEINGESIFY
jgi:hypothetical protein